VLREESEQREVEKGLLLGLWDNREEEPPSGLIWRILIERKEKRGVGTIIFFFF